MQSLKGQTIGYSKQQIDGNTQFINTNSVRVVVQSIENQFKIINEQIVKNLKQFDDIVLDNKQNFEGLNRNLQDIEKLMKKDIEKFNENVQKSIQYNQAVYQRIEKDVKYLSDDQSLLNKKLQTLDKRITQMEDQIGHLSFKN